MDVDGICSLLLQTTLFEHLERERVRELVAAGTQRTAPAETMLFHEGDRCDSVFVILEGAVDVFKLGTDNNEVLLNTLGPGAHFGELALLRGGHRTASVRTILPTALFVLGRDEFLGALMQSQAALSGTLAGLVDLVLESSDRVVEAADRRRQLAVELELQRHRAISQMVTGVAHELNTPLGIANSASSMVAEIIEDLNRAQAPKADALEDLSSSVDLMQRNIRRAARLIDSFKRLSVRQMTRTPESIDDLPTLIEEVITLLNLRNPSTGIRIRFVHALPPEDRSWYGVPGFVSQVLENLVSNAERYAYPYGEGEVVVELSATAEHYVIDVRDEGVGIPEDVQSRIFDPFFTTGRSRGGTGLGLAIARNTVTEGLGGTMTVASTLGEGTVFTFTLERSMAR